MPLSIAFGAQGAVQTLSGLKQLSAFLLTFSPLTFHWQSVFCRPNHFEFICNETYTTYFLLPDISEFLRTN